MKTFFKTLLLSSGIALSLPASLIGMEKKMSSSSKKMKMNPSELKKRFASRKSSSSSSLEKSGEVPTKKNEKVNVSFEKIEPLDEIATLKADNEKIRNDLDFTRKNLAIQLAKQKQYENETREMLVRMAKRMKVSEKKRVAKAEEDARVIDELSALVHLVCRSNNIEKDSEGLVKISSEDRIFDEEESLRSLFYANVVKEINGEKSI